MKNGERPIANPLVVLREEFDDWAVLFDPDSGNAFGLSPTGVYVWKHLDGKHSIDDMLTALRGDAHDVPQEAGEHLAAFVEELTACGLVGYDVEPAHDDKGRIPLCPICISEKVADAIQFAYEPPKLINLSGEQAAHGDCYTGSGASGTCGGGNSATICCSSGNGVSGSCCGGCGQGDGCYSGAGYIGSCGCKGGDSSLRRCPLQ
jgi:SynChlorMet cassette protein ScmD